jgi:adenylate cyclase
VGASVPLGQGVVGVAAERSRNVRLNHLRRGLNMVRAIHLGAAGNENETRRIPFVGIVNAQSQMAVPMVMAERLLGVLYAEDTRPGAFSSEHEHIAQIIAHTLARDLLNEAASEPESSTDTKRTRAGAAQGSLLRVRYYETDSSVFFDGEYVIKSLPGSILTKLLREHVENGRTDFTLKELRLDPALQNHAGRDNIDARLILLRRRLEERFPFVRIERTGRGCFRLVVDRTVTLERG